MSNADEGAAAPERLHALDAVRGGALLLGIVFHATLSFLPTPAKLWIVQDSHRSVALGVLFFTTHVFRMTTFFLIAGFFAHMSFHRRGGAAFIADRLKRIAVPLVVGWPIVFGAIVAVSVWAARAANLGQPPGTPPPSFPTFPRFPLTHLWFLYVLLEFYAAILILRGAVALIDRGGGIRAGLDRLVRLVMRGPLGALVMAVPVGVAFAANPKWLMWFGVPTPDQSFVTNATAWTGFGCAFGFGWLLHRQLELLQNLERNWVLNLTLATLLIMVCLAIAGVSPRVMPIQDSTLRLAGAACYAAATWTTTFAVIGLALHFLSGFSPARRYIADASYWLYIIHLPIVMALQVAVAQLDWPWPVKFAAILAVAFPLMFASYEFIVRHSFVGFVLNGRRVPRHAGPPRQAPSDASALMAGPQETPR
jgi:peptidoglycan/LPS O-acetylase OafA/YrhL